MIVVLTVASTGGPPESSRARGAEAGGGRGLTDREALQEAGWGASTWLEGVLRCFGLSGAAPVPRGCELTPTDMNFLVEGFAQDCSLSARGSHCS